MAHDVFISYSHKDKPTADAICAKLEAGGLRCWYAPRDIIPGADWAPAIIEAIESSRVLILVFTSHSNASQQVMREVSTAIQQGIPIIPFKLTREEPSKSMQYYLATVHWLDAMDGPLYSNIQVLEARVMSVLGEKTEYITRSAEKPAGNVQPVQNKKPTTGKSKKMNYILTGIILVLLAVILWQSGWFSEKEPKETPVPESIAELIEAPAEAPTEALTKAPAEVSTEAPTEAPTAVPIESPTEASAGITDMAEADQKETGLVAMADQAGQDYSELRQMDEELKQKVKRLIIVGDKVYVNFVYEDYSPEQDGPDDTYLYDKKAGQRISTLPGTLKDLSLLKGMSRLDTLWLINQPLVSLEGIENLTRLKEIQILGCKNLEDLSAAFSLEAIETVRLMYNHIKTLDGCEKLKGLAVLNICDENLDDLNALSHLDTSKATEERGGFELFVDCPQISDFTFLNGTPKYERFGIAHSNPDLWVHELEQSKIGKMDVTDCFRAGPEQFETFVELLKKSHPEITELQLNYNPDIMDLSGLAEMPNLKLVAITSNMEDAIESLEGVECRFVLEVDGAVKEPTKAEPAEKLADTQTQEPAGVGIREERSTSSVDTEEDYSELRQMDADAKKKVKRLIITGDRVYVNFIYEDYLPQQNGPDDIFLYDKKAGQKIDSLSGTLTDLSLLDGMEKLDTLWLINEPLASLDGIEKLTRLKEIQVCGCKNLEDISAMFDCEGIETIGLQYNNHIKTLEGCEKLRNLTMITIMDDQLDDLSSLSRLDVSHAVTERGGFDASIDCPEVHDYSWLSNIPAYEFIGIAHANPDLWINELEKSSINRLSAVDCFRSGPEQFESFAEILKKNHPEITELHINYNTDIMDLSGLAEMLNLKKVMVTGNMEDAIDSLKGIQYHFELEISD